MNLKLTALIVAFLFAMTAFPSLANGWVVDTHDYMCPQDYTIDCKIADYAEIHNKYPYTTHLSLSHLCLDNKTDGAARLVANYYLKKYYVERQNDSNYLAIAAHFLQDASCPAHRYSPFNPFAPSWESNLEDQVNSYVISGEKNWSISIEFQGETGTIDNAYLIEQKNFINDYLSKEPIESLEELSKQMEAVLFWTFLRAFSELLLLVVAIMSPFIAYSIVKWKRKVRPRKFKLLGLTESIAILAIFLILALLPMFFY